MMSFELTEHQVLLRVRAKGVFRMVNLYQLDGTLYFQVKAGEFGRLKPDGATTIPEVYWAQAWCKPGFALEQKGLTDMVAKKVKK